MVKPSKFILISLSIYGILTCLYVGFMSYYVRPGSSCDGCPPSNFVYVGYSYGFSSYYSDIFLLFLFSIAVAMIAVGRLAMGSNQGKQVGSFLLVWIAVIAIPLNYFSYILYQLIDVFFERLWGLSALFSSMCAIAFLSLWYASIAHLIFYSLGITAKGTQREINDSITKRSFIGVTAYITLLSPLLIFFDQLQFLLPYAMMPAYLCLFGLTIIGLPKVVSFTKNDIKWKRALIIFVLTTGTLHIANFGIGGAKSTPLIEKVVECYKEGWGTWQYSKGRRCLIFYKDKKSRRKAIRSSQPFGSQYPIH